MKLSANNKTWKRKLKKKKKPTHFFVYGSSGRRRADSHPPLLRNSSRGRRSNRISRYSVVSSSLQNQNGMLERGFSAPWTILAGSRCVAAGAAADRDLLQWRADIREEEDKGRKASGAVAGCGRDVRKGFQGRTLQIPTTSNRNCSRFKPSVRLSHFPYLRDRAHHPPPHSSPPKQLWQEEDGPHRWWRDSGSVEEDERIHSRRKNKAVFFLEKFC